MTFSISEKSTLLIAPRGVLAVVLQPSLLDLWVDLASQAPWCRTAFAGRGRCGEAWNSGLVLGNGGVKLEVASVDGRCLSVVDIEVKTKEFVHLRPPHGSLGNRVGPHLGPVDAGPPKSGAVYQAQVCRVEKDRCAFQSLTEIRYLRAILHSNIFGQMFKPMAWELNLQLAREVCVDHKFWPFWAWFPLSCMAHLWEIRARRACCRNDEAFLVGVVLPNQGCHCDWVLLGDVATLDGIWELVMENG